MKIIQINAIAQGGSTGRICQELTEWLNFKNHSCTILYAIGNVAAANCVKISSDILVKINGALARFFGLDAGFSYISTYRIIYYLKKEKPDLVHLHNLHSNYVNIKLLLNFLAKNRIATILTLHDCWFFTGKCTHYTEIQCYKWKEHCGNCPKLKSDIPSLFFDRTEYLLKEKKKAFSAIKKIGVIGVSDWITGQAKDSILKDIASFKRIYNWIDLNIFKPKSVEYLRSKYCKFNHKIKILCISGEWNKKSVRFQDLMALSKNISEDYIILLVGKYATPSDLPSNILYLGYVDSINYLADLYSYADIYVHLSHEDTFGKVVAEAMACGTPAIVYNVTALPELVANGRGYLVEKGDIDDIVKKLLIFKKVRKSAFSLKCIEFVTNNFKKEVLLKKTEDFYKYVVSK